MRGNNYTYPAQHKMYENKHKATITNGEIRICTVTHYYMCSENVLSNWYLFEDVHKITHC